MAAPFRIQVAGIRAFNEGWLRRIEECPYPVSTSKQPQVDFDALKTLDSPTATTDTLPREKGRQAMQVNKFPIGVAEHLNWYVYRLIDPRNGETFYVGKGKGDRIFQHAKGALTGSKDEDAIDLKFQRIKDIETAGLEVAHVVHMHGIDNEKTAFQIEAALIDAYPGLSNRVGGHKADDYGVRHVAEIIADYTSQPFQAQEPLLLISIAKSYEDETKDIYDAVRGCWRIDSKRAKKVNLVLAHRRGLVLGAFRPNEWLPATKANFSWLVDDIPKRIGFVGEPADAATWKHYVQKRVADQYRAKGAANPVRFIETG